MKSVNHIDPLAFLSANQSDLVNKYLNPEGIKLDERSTSELLAFIIKLSKQFWYYNREDQTDGDWSDFFKTDLTALLANISEANKSEEYDLVIGFLNGIPHTYSKSRQSRFLWETFERTFDTLLDINEWYQVMTQYYVDQPFQIYLDQIIWQKLSFTLRELYAYYYHAIKQEVLHDKEKIDNMFKKLQKLKPIWNFSPFPNFESPIALEYQFELDTVAYVEGVQNQVKDLYQYYDAIRIEARKEFDISLTSGETEPHVALLVSFLKVYKHQQRSLNDLLPRHLNFYYKDVLAFNKKGASPDNAYLIFTLNKSLSSYTLPANTQLSGGTDAKGNSLTYTTDQELMVLSSVVSDYLTVYGEGASLDDRIFYSSSIDSYDKPVIDPNTNTYEDFFMFGEPDETTTTPSEVDLGFSIASPELWVEGGTRVLTVTFNLTADASQQGDLTGLLNFSITGTKAWLNLSNTTISTSGQQLTITLTLDNSVEAVSGYNEKIHGAGFNTTWPVLKATLNNTPSNSEIVRPNPYSAFSSLNFNDFEISTTVTNLSILTIKTSAGTVPASSKATVFGNVPVVGSKFYVGSYEPFIKYTSSLCLSLNWLNLPDFSTYYEAYNTYMKDQGMTDPNFATANYEGSFEWLTSGQWTPGSADQKLFGSNTCTKFTASTDVEPGLTSVFYDTGITGMTPYYNLANPPTYSDKAKSGFVSLELTAPGVAFGNALYPQVVSDVTLKNTMTAAKQFTIGSTIWKILKGLFSIIITGPVTAFKKASNKLFKTKFNTQKPSKGPKFLAVPNKPYLPQVKGVSISYESSHTITPGTDTNHQFYRTHPFGIEQVEEGNTALLAQYPESGYVFLGFDQLTVNSTLTLFLGVKDSLNTTISEDFTEVIVEYLTSSGWETTKVLSDSTFGLAKTGTISFQFDNVPSSTNPIMPTGTFWIRISGTETQVNRTQLTMLSTNAVSVTRVMSSENEWTQLDNIPSGTIKNFIQPVQSISKVDQPFASFGGEEPQTSKAFRQSVAQRINHKERGVSVQNIQDIVLDKFKEIYQVNVVPGKELKGVQNDVITVTLVPLITSGTQSDAYRPISDVSALSEVYNELVDKMNETLTLQVEHAQFEELTIHLDVTFIQSDQSHDLVVQLNSDLKDFLSPWIEGNQLANSKAVLNVNDLIKFIGSRTYVVSFDDFSLCLNNKLVYGSNSSCDPNTNDEDSEVIYPSDPRNIIISAATHDIKNTTSVGTIGNSQTQILQTV